MARARRAATLALGLVALAFLAACGGSDNPAIEGTPPIPLPRATILGVEVMVHGTAAATTGTVPIEVVDDYYSPTIIVGAPGAPVLLALRNDGLHPHNFSLPALHISSDIAPGASRSVAVRFPTSGTLAFFCRFHRVSAAMIGELRADRPVPSPT